jgi:hypothetical protein
MRPHSAPIDRTASTPPRSRLSWSLVTAALLVCAPHRMVAQDTLNPIADQTARLQTLSFTGPSTVNYRNNTEWDEAHASYYTPTATLDQPMDVDMSLLIWVMENKRWDGDDHLATFHVTFPAGQTNGIIHTNNDSEERSRGFPAVTHNKFWLVATKANKIKGNVGKGDDSHANVYIIVHSGGVKQVGDKKYLIHTVDGRGHWKRSSEKSIHTT